MKDFYKDENERTPTAGLIDIFEELEGRTIPENSNRRAKRLRQWRERRRLLNPIKLPYK